MEFCVTLFGAFLVDAFCCDTFMFFDSFYNYYKNASELGGDTFLSRPNYEQN